MKARRKLAAAIIMAEKMKRGMRLPRKQKDNKDADTSLVPALKDAISNEKVLLGDPVT